jgi:hypothetical protein
METSGSAKKKRPFSICHFSFAISHLGRRREPKPAQAGKAMKNDK